MLILLVMHNTLCNSKNDKLILGIGQNFSEGRKGGGGKKTDKITALLNLGDRYFGIHYMIV